MNNKTESWVMIFFLASLLLAVLMGFLSGSRVLLTTDAAISGSNQSLGEVLSTCSSGVSSQRLIGTAATPLQPPINNLLKGLSPSGILWNNWNYSLGCFLASCVLFVGFLRKRVIGVAAALALVGAFWVGTNFTLIYAGHNHKPFVVLFFVCALLPVTYAAAGSIWAALLWGACIGLMFMQQPDISMFFALFAGAYFVFRLWEAQGFKPLRWLKVLIPAAAVAFLFAGGPLLSGYERFVKDATQMQTQNKQEKQAKWDFVTQWSFPPDEMIAFVAPGYTGWRSGEPEGPYWGRLGRSPGWEQTRQGFQNFKLENNYLGLIPIAFALFSLISCRRSKHRPEILFWGCAALVALLLSFGKFTPLYSLFYTLPVVNNVRHPNKFLQVFQICLAILAAYGMDGLFRVKSKVESRKQEGKVESRKSKVEIQTSDLRSPSSDLRPSAFAKATADMPSSALRWFFWGLVCFSAVLTLAALVVTLDRSGGVGRFVAQGWPRQAAQVIVANKIYALWHAVFMAVVMVAVFAVFYFKSLEKLLNFRNWIAAALVLIVAVDAVSLSKHYVKEMPRSYIQANALTDFLQDNLGNQRVALLSQQGIYGIWTTYLLPYNNILTFNFSDMPRMATDYKAFLEAGQKNPLNMWRFSAVKYLLGPTSVEKQLVGQARKVFSYDLARGTKPEEFKVVPSATGQQAVFELLDTYPRYAVVAPVKPMPDKQALAAVSAPPRAQVGSAKVLSYRPGKVKLRVLTKAQGMLRIAEKWDSDWKAEVDGEPTEVKRIDFICQGVDVPAGEHEVILAYKPSKLFLYMQMLGCAVLLVALVAGFVMKRRGRGGIKELVSK